MEGGRDRTGGPGREQEERRNLFLELTEIALDRFAIRVLGRRRRALESFVALELQLLSERGDLGPHVGEFPRLPPVSQVVDRRPPFLKGSRSEVSRGCRGAADSL